jgi:hypothetical protein
MDILFYGVSGLVVLFLLLIVAEPYRFFPEEKPEKKKVGSTYWGVYEGASFEEAESEKTIVIEKSKRKERTVYGSRAYAAGRGVKLTGING